MCNSDMLNYKVVITRMTSSFLANQILTLLLGINIVCLCIDFFASSTTLGQTLVIYIIADESEYCLFQAMTWIILSLLI